MEKLINALEIYKLLNIKDDFITWIESEIFNHQLVEEKDYFIKLTKNIKGYSDVEYYLLEETVKNNLLQDTKESGSLVELKDSYTITEIAKILGVKAKEINQKLLEMNIQHKKNGYWQICDEYKNRGYIVNDQFIRNEKTIRYMKWTLLGREFIFSIYIKER